MTDESAFYRRIIDSLDEGVYFVDRSRQVTYWSRGAERITGHTNAQVLGQCCSTVLLGANEQGKVLCETACPLNAVMEDGRPREAEVYLHHADGHRVPVLVRIWPMRGPSGEVIGAVETFRDHSSVVTAQARISELSRAAEQDPLTEVGNRRAMEPRIAAALCECREQLAPSGVLFVDVDHFKRVNDRYGHALGDQVLRMVASTLRCNVRASDFVARWGGEEFVVLLAGLGSEQALEAIAEKLRRMVQASSLTTTRGPVGVTVSVGATLVRPEDTLEGLVERADRLLYASKVGGRNRVSLAA
jgi:diguanylate cyclase (GGDEF)-like protein/PAS domain S-box-containing protein